MASQTPPRNARVAVFDTTLRDGEQAPGFHMTEAGKLRIARELARLRVDVIEAGFAASSPAERRAISAIAATVGRGARAPEICALARCVDADIDAAGAAVAPARRGRVHVFIATSELHIAQKLRMTKSEVLDRISRSVARAARLAPHVQFSAEDASRSDPAFLAAAVRRAVEAGARTINIPDTVGYALPDEFGQRIRRLRHAVPALNGVIISVHCHDDLGMAVANSIAGIRAGARQVECTINGIGERAGNGSLEEIVMAIRVRRESMGVETGVDARRLCAASRAVAQATGQAVAANKAVVGENAFAHASGIHQDGIIKRRETYEIMRPGDVGAPDTKLVLTARSGRRAVQARLASLGIQVAEASLDRVFERFKVEADRCPRVDDAQLRVIARAP